ncbi:hypothetical protein chiPu_0022774 [Chiloscyllium punctatum]|uniref:Uncharacterized protein n=1 Tax=Chiloscyllium punctatum TaxID=137246 RepID=A0A401T9V5_CHIPU|nr:hypothetical protein [Chiloscyllium punctatum]
MPPQSLSEWTQWCVTSLIPTAHLRLTTIVRLDDRILAPNHWLDLNSRTSVSLWSRFPAGNHNIQSMARVSDRNKLPRGYDSPRSPAKPNPIQKCRPLQRQPLVGAEERSRPDRTVNAGRAAMRRRRDL